MYSVQQIKFECLAYIKEFGVPPARWSVVTCRKPVSVMQAHGVDGHSDIWMWKPAASPIAAHTVLRFLIDRMGVQAASNDEADGDCVVLYLKRG